MVVGRWVVKSRFYIPGQFHWWTWTPALATVKRIDPTRIFYRRDICIPFLAITSAGSVSTKCGWSVVYSAAALSIDVVDDDHDQLTYDDIDGTWMGCEVVGIEFRVFLFGALAEWNRSGFLSAAFLVFSF